VLEDLSSACLRYELLRYCLNPVTQRITLEGINVDELRVQARTANRSKQKPSRPFESWFEVDVFLKIIARGYRVIPQYRVAGYRIDLVVEGTSARLAVEADGDEWHGAEEYQRDLERQRTLERCGWKFWRVRGGEFYRDQDGALATLWDEITARGIEIASDQHERSDVDGYVPNIDWAMDLNGHAQVTMDGARSAPEVPSTRPTSTRGPAQNIAEKPEPASVQLTVPPVTRRAGKPPKPVVDRASSDAVRPLPRPAKPKPEGSTHAGQPAEGDNELIGKAMDIDADVWFTMAHWARTNDFLTGHDRKMLYDMGRKKAREEPLSVRQARYALSLYRKCFEKGCDNPSG
jgi:very-short-patch-repair endonuclease